MGRRRSSFKKSPRWTYGHAACRLCGTTERPHVQYGLCSDCFSREILAGDGAFVPEPSLIANLEVIPEAERFNEVNLLRWGRRNSYQPRRGPVLYERPIFQVEFPQERPEGIVDKRFTLAFGKLVGYRQRQSPIYYFGHRARLSDPYTLVEDGQEIAVEGSIARLTALVKIATDGLISDSRQIGAAVALNTPGATWQRT